MKSYNDTTNVPTLVSNLDVASGGDCVITIAAVEGQRHTIDWILFGYAGTPDAGTAMTITDGVTTLQVPMTTQGPGEFTFGVRGAQFGKGLEVVVTLEDGSQVKDLNLQYR